MNGEKGIDLNTDFQRSYVDITKTEEKTSLLRNNETKEFIFFENPTVKDGFSNYHLHIYFPKRDNFIGRENHSIKGYWSVELLESCKLRNGKFIGPHHKPVIFDPDIHSLQDCRRILASTKNLIDNNPDWVDNNFDDLPDFDNSIMKDVYKICNSLIEVYVKMQGSLRYVMVQPFYSSVLIPDLGEITLVDYKEDINNFIAVFPALPYNIAELENQIY